MDFTGIIYALSVAVLPVFMGIVFHEVAHAYAAYAMGDTTAKELGRLTLNPIAHLDKAGSMFFVLTVLFSPIVFGWAKPVPVNPRRFTKISNVKTGMMLVSLAGPMTNFAIAIMFAVLLKLLTPVLSHSSPNSFWVKFVVDTITNGVSLNLILMVLNLMPIPPLDGSHIVSRFLPYPLDYKYMEFRKYGTIAIIILIASGIFTIIMQFFLNLLYPLIYMIIR